ncbi:MAG: nitrophenyl compound nitroreductase subunit ArsF family protein [bacterium]
MAGLRRATTILLLLFVVASVVTLIAKEVSHRETGESSTREPSTRAIPLTIVTGRADGVCRVVACYFHNTVRCATCLQIEQAARETVEKTFSAELASGRLTWMAMNMEEEAYRAYATLFDMAMPTLILVRVDGDAIAEWAPLENTWGLIRNPDRFSMYIADNVRVFLEACP